MYCKCWLLHADVCMLHMTNLSEAANQLCEVKPANAAQRNKLPSTLVSLGTFWYITCKV